MRIKILVFIATLLGFIPFGGFAATIDDPQPATGNETKEAAKKQQQEDDIKKLQEVLDKAKMTGNDVASWVRCNVGENEKKCDQADRLYINASQISILEIIGLPDNTCVYVMSGEDVGGSHSCFVHADRVWVAVQKQRNLGPTYSKAKAAGKCEGNSPCPGNTTNKRLNSALRSALAKSPDTGDLKVALIPYVTEGNSSRLVVHTFDQSGLPLKIVDVPLVYQPWFVDSGGFLAFTTLVDKEITKHDVGNGNVKIDNVRWSNRLTPNTGLAINFHPANYPNAGIQFGLTTVEEKVTYHLGGAYRLRSIGPKAIATIAAGLAVGQVNRFPDVAVGDTRSSTDAGLNGTKRWATGAYLSLSFGFTFGNGNEATTESKKAKVSSP